jgi:hypothetical protein
MAKCPTPAIDVPRLAVHPTYGLAHQPAFDAAKIYFPAFRLSAGVRSFVIGQMSLDTKK